MVPPRAPWWLTPEAGVALPCLDLLQEKAQTLRILVEPPLREPALWPPSLCLYWSLCLEYPFSPPPVNSELLFIPQDQLKSHFLRKVIPETLLHAEAASPSSGHPLYWATWETKLTE